MTHPAWAPKGDRFAFSWIDQDLWKEEVWAKWGLKVFDFQTIYVASRQEGVFQQIVPQEGRPARDPVWSPRADGLLYTQKIDLQYQLFKIPVEGGGSKQLTDSGTNRYADWFDPSALSIELQTEKMTTIWGQLKQK